jgi:hypothetical protein
MIIPMPHYELVNGKRGKLLSDYIFSTPITGYRVRLQTKTERADLFPDGRLVIYAPTEWDFGSGPAVNTPAMVYASLAHDIFCVMTNLRLLPWSCRGAADKYFWSCLTEAGAATSRWWRAPGVMLYSQLVARWKDRRVKYLVQVKGPQTIKLLRAMFDKVGNPQAMHTLVIVTTSMPAAAINAVPGVISAEPDSMASIEEVSQPAAPQWALPWISNTGGESYVNSKSGAGVDIYILDTGIMPTHTDFAGRLRQLYSHDGLSYDPQDAVSPTHGTNVAGCAAGTVYGTAKQASIVNCRTDFTNSDILKALDTILKDHLTKPADVQSVLNFSGSSGMSLIGNAFAKLADYGVVIVAAAGNYSEPEPRYPAASWYVEGVGSIDSSGVKSGFSNSGVSVWGPGENITTAGIGSSTASQTTSGTSFSAPYYAGLLACQLQGSSKFNTMSLATNFTFYSRSLCCDDGRMIYFPSSIPSRSMSTRNQNGANPQYYLAPSLEYTDAEVLGFLLQNEHNPAGIAQAARDGNVDLARLVRVTGYTAQQINDYFIAAGVVPWWFVDGQPV